jgi:hypothetical protein
MLSFGLQQPLSKNATRRALAKVLLIDGLSFLAAPAPQRLSFPNPDSVSLNPGAGIQSRNLLNLIRFLDVRDSLTSLHYAWKDNQPSKRFVFEVAFTFQRLGVFVFAKNVFVELDIGTKEILEPRYNSLAVL